MFAAISGSSIVTMLAIGSIMYPAMRQAGYDHKFSLGAIMSGGTLGIIIPPSIPMIIYGLVTETSVTDLFASGFGPGSSSPWRCRPIRCGSTGACRPAVFDLDEFWLAFKNGIWAATDAGHSAGRHLLRLLHSDGGCGGGALYALVVEIFLYRS